MSTIIGLGDLAEDEIIARPLPVEILLENLKLNLIEDRPPVNITSPGPFPINLHIGKLRVTRDEMGLLQIQPLELDKNVPDADADTAKNEDFGHQQQQQQQQQQQTRDRELLSMQLVMQQLKNDNEQLKKQLELRERSSETIK